MEKAKPSKKKGYYKNRKPETGQIGNNECSHSRPIDADNASFTDRSAPQERPGCFSKRTLQQPDSRLAELDEIWQQTNVGQDFQTLVNAPLSADCHFVFKSEKNWMLDASKHYDFFSVDVKYLAAIIACIPYNDYVQVDRKYFTRDELTDIDNTAEQGKRAYDDTLVESLKMKNMKSATNETRLGDDTGINDSGCERDGSSTDCKVKNEAYQDSRNNIEERDLDFLLSLKEPVKTHHYVSIGSHIKSEESKRKNVPAAAVTKSIDLEKWLDLLLED